MGHCSGALCNCDAPVGSCIGALDSCDDKWAAASPQWAAATMKRATATVQSAALSPQWVTASAYSAVAPTKWQHRRKIATAPTYSAAASPRWAAASAPPAVWQLQRRTRQLQRFSGQLHRRPRPSPWADHLGVRPAICDANKPSDRRADGQGFLFYTNGGQGPQTVGTRRKCTHAEVKHLNRWSYLKRREPLHETMRRSGTSNDGAIRPAGAARARSCRGAVARAWTHLGLEAACPRAFDIVV